MRVGGVSLAQLAEDFQTPLFVIDEDDLRARARAYRDAFAVRPDLHVDVYYAGKAFLASAIVRIVRDQGLGLDVCSGGELWCALAAGMPAPRILFHGNNKSEAELAAALDARVGRIVVDSLAELRRLSALAGERGVVAPVLVRVTVGVEAHTHEFIATAHEDQKFGFSIASGSAMAAVAEVLADPNLDLVGVHSHIGSQIFVASGFEVAAHRAVRFLDRIRAEHGVVVTELNLGGGLGIKYTEEDAPPEVSEIAAELLEIVVAECQRYGLPVPRLAFEPGRAIVGPSTLTVYRVGTIKRRTLEGGQQRVYVSVDGGMSDNIRTALYDADYTVALANRGSTARAMLTRVVGKHCESGDIVVRDAWLPDDLAPGDLIAVAATGAYHRSMASNYNLVTRPAVVSVSAGTVRVVLRRESLAELFATDVGLSASDVSTFGP
jgi:diaminopimelate decarboxylase